MRARETVLCNRHRDNGDAAAVRKLDCIALNCLFFFPSPSNKVDRNEILEAQLCNRGSCGMAPFETPIDLCERPHLCSLNGKTRRETREEMIIPTENVRYTKFLSIFTCTSHDLLASRKRKTRGAVPRSSCGREGMLVAQDHTESARFRLPRPR